MSVEIHSGKGALHGRPRIDVPPEVRIAFEVALELRMSPKYTDDGTPEGTIERPLSFRAPTVTVSPMPEADLPAHQAQKKQSQEELEEELDFDFQILNE